MNRHVSYVLPLALAACSGSGTGEISSSKQRETAPSISADEIASAATSERTFGLALYGQLAKASPGNVFFSPHSIEEALSMTYAGAAGATASQMRSVLAYALPDDKIHQAMNGLDLALESRGHGQVGVDGNPFKLSVANALWGQTGYSFLPTFLDTLAQSYGAGVRPLDFVQAPDPSRITINDWVASATNDKIKDLLPEGSITRDTRLVLTNAVYFNASWATPFAASATTSDSFTTLAGATVQAPTMHAGFEGYGYAADGIEVAKLDYAGNELSMIVIEPSDLTAFESTLTPAVLDGLVGKLKSAYVTLSLPKWKVTDSHGLAEPLKALGMTDAFDLADFSGMDGAKDFVLADVVHKAFIAVDENGTEAAAATAVVVGTTSVNTDQLTLTFDHPYLYLIRDNATGAVVFMGRVADPTK